MNACPECGTQIPDQGSFCPACGQSTALGNPAPPVTARDRVLAALGYLFLPAIVFLFIEPFRRNHFIRFHALQSVFLWPALLITAGVIKLLSLLLLLLPTLGQLTIFLLWILFALAAPILLLVCVVKALLGEEFGLSLFANMLERPPEERSSRTT